jgi:hypothetical protein
MQWQSKLGRLQAAASAASLQQQQQVASAASLWHLAHIISAGIRAARRATVMTAILQLMIPQQMTKHCLAQMMKLMILLTQQQQQQQQQQRQMT